MKIIKKKRKAIELGLLYYVKYESREEYNKIMEWHKELKHFWGNYDKIDNFDGFDLSFPYIKLRNSVTRASSPEKGMKISFNKFLELAYA